MFDEMITRVRGFRSGMPIFLADGCRWQLPLPDGGDLANPDYQAILETLRQANDVAEYQLGESILAVYLLRKNYSVTAAQIRHLLGVGASASTRADLAAELHQVAAVHLGQGPGVAPELPTLATRTVA